MVERDFLMLSDQELLAQCEMTPYRASGPGGQKRNKTSSAVRLLHRPTGLMVTAEDSRSQHVNRRHALTRLRKAIALTRRQPLPKEKFSWPTDLAPYRELRINPKNKHYFRVVQRVLDVLSACNGKLKPAAEILGCSPTRLNRFCRADKALLQKVQSMK